MIASKLFKSTALYGILNFLPLGSRFLLFPLFVNYLTPFDFGLIGLHASVANLMTILISFGLDSAYTRFYFDYEDNQKSARAYLSTIFILVLVIGASLGLLLFLVGDLIFSGVFNDDSYAFNPFGIYAYIFGFGVSLNAIILIHLRNREEPVKYFLFSASVFLLMISLECLIVFGENPSAEKVLLARVIGLIAPSFLFWVFTFYKGFTFNIKLLSGSFTYALPVFVYTLLGFTYLYFDRILVGNMLTVEKLSIYTAALMIASVLELSLHAIDLAITPTLFRFYKKDEFTPARKLLNSVGSFVYLLAAAILILSPIFIKYFMPEFYQPAIRMIPIFLIGYVFRFLFGAINKELYFFKKVKKIPLINFAAGAALIVSSVLLVPTYGLIGAAWAMVISRFATVLLSIIIIKVDLGDSFRFTKMYRNAVVVICIFLLPIVYPHFIITYGVFYISAFIVVLLFVSSFFNKNGRIKSLIKNN